MLAELTISNFVIIARLNLRFAAGLNVFTGETGAGKSILIDAVSLLLGGRADSNYIRAGADRATVEGIFHLSASERAALDPALSADELQGDDPDMLILARELRRSGHNVCRVNGRAVRLRVLEEIGAHLIDIHGQSEHLSLLQERTHLEFLDRYAGLEGERRALAERVTSLRAVRRELRDLMRSERELNRRADLLRFQVQEIEAAALSPGEDEALVQERNRLANAERLTEVCNEALALLSLGEDDGPTALDLVGQTVRAMSNLARIDPQTETMLQQVKELEYAIGDFAAALQGYQSEIEFNPARLNQVEERLALIRRLQRKYGERIEDILAFGEHAADELDSVEHSGERVVELANREEVLLREIGALAASLSARRRQAGEELAQTVEAELNELRMEGSRFAVSVEWQPHPEGAYVDAPPDGSGHPPGRYAFDTTGIDRVAFLIAPNIGEPLKPMAKVASGGETSRLMLALKTALSRADPIPTLIFDEIDQGIGGRMGGVIGRKLRGLCHGADGLARQVFCVTHLPQLASYADVHINVYKSVSGGRTRTDVDVLDLEARVKELARMLGGDSDSSRKMARELLTHRE